MPVLNDKRLLRQLKRLDTETTRTSQSALARLSWLVREDVQREVGRNLKFFSASTRAFLADRWKLKYGKRQGRFYAVIYPLRRAAEVLARHVERTRVTARDGGDLTYKGRIAIPLQNRLRRGARGRVPKRLTPTELLRRDAKGRNRGYVVGDTIVQRIKGKKTTEPVFALEDSTTTEARLTVDKWAERSVARRAGEAFADAIRRAMKRATG